jgi:hypothetical protein
VSRLKILGALVCVPVPLVVIGAVALSAGIAIPPLGVVGLLMIIMGLWLGLQYLKQL